MLIRSQTWIRSMGGALALVIGLALSSQGAIAESKTRLIVEAERATAWLPISNEFTHVEGSTAPWTAWDGLLFQLGEYEEVYHGFLAVSFHGPGDSLIDCATLHDGEFVWIDIKAVRTSTTPDPGPFQVPMNWNHVSNLMPGLDPNVQCRQVDECADSECLCVGRMCKDSGRPSMRKRKIPRECLRLRSIHHELLPSAILTLWHTPAGYELAASGVGIKRRYEFSIDQGVEIQIYDQDENQAPGTTPVQLKKILPTPACSLNNVEKIIIHAIAMDVIPGDPDHGDHGGLPFPIP